ncbi:MAG: hypothetical protein QOI24_1021 [Acidobacteriota bacterium]|jgi:hypothetical protein|nr:hypothetical protein [Acidobacteriota bacterium]
MLKRTLLACVATALLVAAAPKPSAATAPATIAHPMAMFLAKMSNAKKVTFSARAVGKRFFLEETAGVSVYLFNGNDYRREAFLKGVTLSQAIKRYNKR